MAVEPAIRVDRGAGRFEAEERRIRRGDAGHRPCPHDQLPPDDSATAPPSSTATVSGVASGTGRRSVTSTAPSGAGSTSAAARPAL